ncbi:hypothetical protein HDU89_002234 [Geranomyces variabilis]|nr:hypothetical protein HDU89_002234 [Geranomyces variabilis]
MSFVKTAPSAVQSSATSVTTATTGAGSSGPAPPAQTTLLDLPADDPASLHLASLLLLGNPQQPPAAAGRQRPKTFKPEPPSACMQNLQKYQAPWIQDEELTLNRFLLGSKIAVLSRVAAFLPQLSAANANLQSSIAADSALRDRVDIENVDEDDEQYIEMNLGVGVFDTQPIPADGSRPRRTGDEHEVPSPETEREIIMTTDASDAQHSRSLIQVVSDTRTPGAESDGESSGDSDSGEQ